MNDTLFLWSKPCDKADLKWGCKLIMNKIPKEEDFFFSVNNSSSF